MKHEVDCSDNENKTMKAEATYEYVYGPTHYGGDECITNMRKLYGDEAVKWFCICNAYKYRYRKGKKPGASEIEDEKKANWYETYAVNIKKDLSH